MPSDVDAFVASDTKRKRKGRKPTPAPTPARRRKVARVVRTAKVPAPLR